MSTPLEDEAATKTFFTGTHRTVPPDQTLARMLPLFPAFGITRVANLTGLDRIGVPVVMVCRPNALSSAVFHGKGMDLAAAKASGVMEAIETWHAEHIQLPLRLDSYNELREIAHVADAAGLPSRAGSRFHADLPILWVEGNDLIGGRRTWVPFETVHMNTTLLELPGSGSFAASTNGLASGNHFLEAVSHALCEVIERDAVTLWRHRDPAEQGRRRIDLSTVRDEACRTILARLRAAEIDIAVWDATSDVGVAAFQCLLADTNEESGHVGQGAGCHTSSDIALLRAITEAVQVRTTYIVGSREDIRYLDYRRDTLEGRNRSVRALMRPVDRSRDFASVPSRVFPDFKAEVAWILERLRGVPIRQAIAVDLTRSAFGVAVARVVVPGLEGSDHLPDYAPGARARALAWAPK